MLKLLSTQKAFDGFLIKYSHFSGETSCTMKFNVFLPKKASEEKRPALLFLSGLTCTEDNFVIKSGALKEAAKREIILISPDTSPSSELANRRGCSMQE